VTKEVCPAKNPRMTHSTTCGEILKCANEGHFTDTTVERICE